MFDYRFDAKKAAQEADDQMIEEQEMFLSLADMATLVSANNAERAIIKLMSK